MYSHLLFSLYAIFLVKKAYFFVLFYPKGT